MCACRILALEKLGAVFNQVSTPLQYTPRKFVIHPETANLVVLETDHNAYTDETKLQRKQQMAEEMVEAAGEEEQQLAAEMAAAFLNENLPEDTFGAPKAGVGMWASMLRLISPISGRTLQKIPLEQNEAAFRFVTLLTCILVLKRFTVYLSRLQHRACEICEPWRAAVPVGGNGQGAGAQSTLVQRRVPARLPSERERRKTRVPSQDSG